MPRFARAERHALADSLLAVGPDAPTLCDGWRAFDLAAHLVVRERRPDAWPGLVLTPARDVTRGVMETVKRRGYERVVARFRAGAPWWNPLSLPSVDEKLNLGEFFVHHEDIRRAAPQWTPRVLPAEMEAGLWQRLNGVWGRLLRGAGVAVAVECPGHGRFTVGGDPPEVTLRGAPGEVLLFAFGRQATRVTIEGPVEATARLRAARLGF